MRSSEEFEEDYFAERRQLEPIVFGGLQAAMKRGFQTQDAEMALARMLDDDRLTLDKSHPRTRY